MLKLTLLRHAKSCWDLEGLDDYLRPLADRGYRQATRLTLQFPDDVDEIWCSPAVRAYSTISCLIESRAQLANLVTFKRSIYESNSTELLTLLRSADNQRHLVIVGHNPGLEMLAERLISNDVRLKTCHLAQLILDCDQWSEVSNGCASLESLWRPKVVK